MTEFGSLWAIFIPTQFCQTTDKDPFITVHLNIFKMILNIVLNDFQKGGAYGFCSFCLRLFEEVLWVCFSTYKRQELSEVHQSSDTNVWRAIPYCPNMVERLTPWKVREHLASQWGCLCHRSTLCCGVHNEEKGANLILVCAVSTCARLPLKEGSSLSRCRGITLKIKYAY